MEEQVKNSTENIESSENTENDNLVHDFSGTKSSFLTPKLLVVFIAVILLGVGSGYLLSKNANNGSVSNTSVGGNSSSLSKGATFGSADMKTFNDTTEGVLKNGGIEDEGQFHLIRPGGDDQNVYLTSSIVDLSQFVDKKIKVWGQTQKARVAGWLMDVGKVEIL